MTVLQDIITLTVAIIGAVLGIVNFIREIRRDQVRLKVTPVYLISESGMRIGIEVINTGMVAVTVNNVGFVLQGRKWAKVEVFLCDGRKLPQRLEPRDGFTAICLDYIDNATLGKVLSAKADTACGLTFTGTSEALKELVHEARKRKTLKA